MRTRHRLVFLLTFMAVFVIPFAGTTAQTSADGCTTLHAQLRGDSLLEWVDPQTNQVVRTEQLPYPFAFEHSPDCRFLIGHSTGYGDCEPGLVIWNATSGERMQTLTGFCDTLADAFPHFIWRPDNTAVVISEWYRGWTTSFSWGDRYLWYPDSNQLVPLVQKDYLPYRVQASLFQVEWDDARGWLWSSGLGGVVAFDIHSGLQVVEFHNLPNTDRYIWETSSFFTFSPDHTYIVTHGQRGADGYNMPAITVYDIATGIGVQVNPELNGAGTVALSPDNRYLTMSYTAIRVWDLQNLPENVEDRLPIYRLPLPQSLESRVYFTDNTTLVAETDSGDLRYVYDMSTGQRIE
ncbi:MAG: hypothetical protein U0670_24915 [Anaerolineae bacterium]